MTEQFWSTIAGQTILSAVRSFPGIAIFLLLTGLPHHVTVKWVLVCFMVGFLSSQFGRLFSEYRSNKLERN